MGLASARTPSPTFCDPETRPERVIPSLVSGNRFPPFALDGFFLLVEREVFFFFLRGLSFHYEEDGCVSRSFWMVVDRISLDAFLRALVGELFPYAEDGRSLLDFMGALAPEVSFPVFPFYIAVCFPSIS